MDARLLAAIDTGIGDVTRILSAIEQVDPHAARQFLPLIYDELRRLTTDLPNRGASWCTKDSITTGW